MFTQSISSSPYSLHVLSVEVTKKFTESQCEAHDCECGWPNYGRERGLASRNPLSSINPTVPAVLKQAVSSFVDG